MRRQLRPFDVTVRTISGSGLFHLETGCRPTSAPGPTDDSTCALVNTSASGPMPTSRYWLHIPFGDQRRLDPGGLVGAGLDVAAASRR
jgi:hypothetical protein